MPRECLSALNVGRISGPAVESIETDSRRIRLYGALFRAHCYLYMSDLILLLGYKFSAQHPHHQSDRAVDVSPARAASQQAYHFTGVYPSIVLHTPE